jgi:hypothetical protein
MDNSKEKFPRFGHARRIESVFLYIFILSLFHPVGMAC